MYGGRQFGPAGYVSGSYRPHSMSPYPPPFVDGRRGRVGLQQPYPTPYPERGTRNGGERDWARRQAQRIRDWHRAGKAARQLDPADLTPAEDLGQEEEESREPPQGKAPGRHQAGPAEASGLPCIQNSQREEPGLALRGQQQAQGAGVPPTPQGWAQDSDEEEEEACMAPCSDQEEDV